MKDLEKIKERNKQIEIDIKASSEGLPEDKHSKREEKEIKKLLKEKDALERDALV